MNRFSILTLSILSLCFSFSANAQNISIEETITYINSKLGGRCSIKLDQGVIFAEYFEDGKVYRKDRAALLELDLNKVNFDSTENIFFIPCKENQYECVERQLLVNKIKKYYNRISFVIDRDPKTVGGLTEAFRHAYLLVKGKKGYSRTQPFE